MTDGPPTSGAVITAMEALSAFGRGVDVLVSAALTGKPAFAPVERFDVSGRRVQVAATASGSPDLRAELLRLVRDVTAGLTAPSAPGPSCSWQPTRTLTSPVGPSLARAPQLPPAAVPVCPQWSISPPMWH